MIIFSLECLADDSHRRHFIENRVKTYPAANLWEANYRAYYDDCDKDEPIKSTIHLFEYIGEGAEYGTDTPYVDYADIQIWTTRCESTRKKTEKWLYKHIQHTFENQPILKMRPIGNTESAHVLKEKWYDLHNVENPRQNIDFVFDSDEQSIAMWRRRGVFCFDCKQS